MSFSPALLVVGANAMRSALLFAQLHTGNPGDGGSANKSSAAMVAPSWAVVDLDDASWGLADDIDFTGCTPNGPITYVSFWSATSSGIWYGNFALSGDLTADASGNYSLDAAAFNAAAS